MKRPVLQQNVFCSEKFFLDLVNGKLAVGVVNCFCLFQSGANLRIGKVEELELSYKEAWV
jgi:hypothetical protein